jgi:RES domain-containing protein
MPVPPAKLFNHPDSKRILNGIRTCSSLMILFQGVAYRVATYEWASEHNFLDGVGSRKYGARWNPPGLFKTVYMSCDPETALAEGLARNRRHGLPDGEGLPLVVIGVRIAPLRLLDLSSADVKKRISVSDNELLITAYDESPIETVSQAIGRLGRTEGYDGLLVPSAARLGARNLVVFLNESTAAKMHLINSEKLPKRKRTFSRRISRKNL